jgi:hypothetical protein
VTIESLNPAWISIAALFVAVFAASFAFWSARTADRALRLARDQEQRQPFVMYLVDGYVRSLTSKPYRIYSFLISISNPSDSNNAVARMDLRVSYRTTKNYYGAVDIPLALADPAEQFQQGYATLKVPHRIDAHQTVTGWANFEVANAVLQDCMVEKYTTVVLDPQDQSTEMDCGIVRQLADEAEVTVG